MPKTQRNLLSFLLTGHKRFILSMIYTVYVFSLEPVSSGVGSSVLWWHLSRPLGHLMVSCLVPKLCPTLCDPKNGSPPASLVRRIFQTRLLEWVCHFLFQGIFLTQRLNPGLLHCRQILYCWATQEDFRYLIISWFFWIKWNSASKSHNSSKKMLTKKMHNVRVLS